MLCQFLGTDTQAYLCTECLSIGPTQSTQAMAVHIQSEVFRGSNFSTSFVEWQNSPLMHK